MKRLSLKELERNNTMRMSILIGIGTVVSYCAAAISLGEEIPRELTTPNYRIREITTIGRHAAIERQDPSNVIKVGDTYYVWYTQRKRGTHPYASTVYYAASKDGIHWDDRGEAIGKGEPGAWDRFGVITPYMAAVDGKYYLFYTGTSADKPFKSRGPGATLRHIGVAVADSPDGPWQKFENNPVLSPGEGAWDSVLVDDAHLIGREGKCWLYFKGCHHDVGPGGTQWGLAIADHPTGPYVKSEYNPLIGGHTVCVWPHRQGIAALVDGAGPEKHTVQWSTDGIHFHRAAKIPRVHTGCGPYDPDAFTNAHYGRGITWGVAQNGNPVHIVRFEVDLTAPQSPNVTCQTER
jgi:hypothetical protein